MAIKKYILLFLLFLFVQSNYFVNRVTNIDKTVNIDGSLNMYGNVIQSIFLVLCFMLIELLVNNELL